MNKWNFQDSNSFHYFKTLNRKHGKAWATRVRHQSLKFQIPTSKRKIYLMSFTFYCYESRLQWFSELEVVSRVKKKNEFHELAPWSIGKLLKRTARGLVKRTGDWLCENVRPFIYISAQWPTRASARQSVARRRSKAAWKLSTRQWPVRP